MKPTRELVRLIPRRLPSWQAIALSLGGVVLGVSLVGLATWLWPHHVSLSYASNTCVAQAVLFPTLVHSHPSASLSATLESPIRLAGFPILSRTTCLHLAAAPASGTREVVTQSIAGFRALSRTLVVEIGQPPAVAPTQPTTSPVSVTGQLSFRLSQADGVYDYRLAGGTRSTDCQRYATEITCPLAGLQLGQGVPAVLSLSRLFQSQAQSQVWEGSVQTVAALHVTSSTITAEQVIYDTPTSVVLTLDREVDHTEKLGLFQIVDGTRVSLPVATTASGQSVTIAFATPLPRAASLILEISQIQARDGGRLDLPYSLSFKTSGGPKVVGSTAGTTKLPAAGPITLTFDSPLLRSQPVRDYVRLEGPSGAVPASISVGERSITIRPSSPLSACTPYTLRILDGLRNAAGIAGGSAWELRTRTTCQSSYSIGTSVAGRAIMAYQFGSGASAMVFVGGTHGNEQSSVYILQNWVDYLEANYDRIPRGRRIVVVPNLNPDGFAANRRTNAHNVDLNRNFPATDWKSGVTMPDLSFNPTGGGSAPLSEPESQAIASLVTSLHPRLVLTYHAVAGVVIPNDAGDSVALATTYDRLATVRILNNSTGFFAYDTTGAFEGWLYNVFPTTTLLIELNTRSGKEFAGHRDAMWSMIQIP